MFSPTTFPDTYSSLTNTRASQYLTSFVGLIVPGVLDIDFLEGKHQELVDLWPALGGKLVKSTSPYSFTTGRTVDFSSRTLISTLEEMIPGLGFDPNDSSSTLPSYHAISPTCDALFHYDTISLLGEPPDNVFTLRVTTLADATLLGFRISHYLVDGEGEFDVVSAYCDLLSGADIPKLVPSPDIAIPLSTLVTGSDVLPDSVVRDVPYTHPKEMWEVPGTLGLIRRAWTALFRMALSKIGFGKRMEQRYIHLSGEFVDRLRKDCQEELNQANMEGWLEEGAGLELTRNDVITAWFLQRAYGHDKEDSNPLNLQYSLNYVPALRPPPHGTKYLHNSSYKMVTHFSSLATFKSLPLSQIALSIRLCCIRGKQPSAVRAMLEFCEANAGALFVPMSLGRNDDDYLPSVSAWTTFGYNRLDFSAALKNKKAEGGSVIFTHPFVTTLKLGELRIPWAIILKDGMGGYWLRANLLLSGWKGHLNKGY